MRIVAEYVGSAGSNKAGIDVQQMLAKALGSVKAIYMVHGYTDLRRSIDGLNVTLEILRHPQEDECLYLFCGRRADRIKGLYRSNGRSSLIVFREDEHRYHWPRRDEEVEQISFEAFLALLDGTYVPSPKSAE